MRLAILSHVESLKTHMDHDLAHDWTAVFDLDGTLVDTIGDLVAALNVVMEAEGCAPLSQTAARAMVGHGARALITRGLISAGRQVGESELARLHAMFLSYYRQNLTRYSRPLPGLLDALDGLEAASWRLAVCTNKQELYARKLLDELGLSQRFRVIVGSDTFTTQKPHPDVYFSTVSAVGGLRARSVMIGDSPTDFATAKAAGVPAILVTFGYSDVPIESLAADAHISSWAELIPALTKIAA